MWKSQVLRLTSRQGRESSMLSNTWSIVTMTYSLLLPEHLCIHSFLPSFIHSFLPSFTHSHIDRLFLMCQPLGRAPWTIRTLASTCLCSYFSIDLGHFHPQTPMHRSRLYLLEASLTLQKKIIPHLCLFRHSMHHTFIFFSYMHWLQS